MTGMVGYEIRDLVYEGLKTLVYRGRATEGEVPVIIKVLKGGRPSPREAARLKREYENARLYADLQHQIIERRRLEREILQISDLERCRIGRELHDGAGQALTAITLLSRALYGKLREKDPEPAAIADKINDLARRANSDMHDLAHDLYPKKLQQGGLIAALDEMATHVTDSLGISCCLHCSHKHLTVDDAVAVHLYRIAQEAVNNAVKHARAKNIVIDLKVGKKSALRIIDDGIGFPKDTPGEQGMGLTTMKYRAGIMGGALKISGDKGGTTITCTF